MSGRCRLRLVKLVEPSASTVLDADRADTEHEGEIDARFVVPLTLKPRYLSRRPDD